MLGYGGRKKESSEKPNGIARCDPVGFLGIKKFSSKAPTTSMINMRTILRIRAVNDSDQRFPSS
jgi:hypothetical protein